MPVSCAALMARATILTCSFAHILLKFYFCANLETRDNFARIEREPNQEPIPM